MEPSNHHPVEFSGVPCKKDGPSWTYGLVTSLYGVTDGRVMGPSPEYPAAGCSQLCPNSMWPAGGARVHRPQKTGMWGHTVYVAIGKSSFMLGKDLPGAARRGRHSHTHSKSPFTYSLEGSPINSLVPRVNSNGMVPWFVTGTLGGWVVYVSPWKGMLATEYTRTT